MERVELIRECEAVQVPAGNVITLEKGIEVLITQSLGGTYTLQVPAYGGLYRIAGKDADALGKTPEAAAATAFSSGDLEAMVWDQLKTCFDPEIPVNIVDLGLVYGMELASLPDGTHKVDVKMTLTAQGCGMGASIAIDAKHKLLTIAGIAEADVDVVWDSAVESADDFARGTRAPRPGVNPRARFLEPESTRVARRYQPRAASRSPMSAASTNQRAEVPHPEEEVRWACPQRG